MPWKCWVALQKLSFSCFWELQQWTTVTSGTLGSFFWQYYSVQFSESSVSAFAGWHKFVALRSILVPLVHIQGWIDIFLCFLGVIILVALANRFRIHKLSNVDQFVMSYGGLRGAVAFALVLLIDPKHVPLQPLFVTTTICVIYFTVFLQGITIKPLVRILNVKRAEKRKPTMNEVISRETQSR